MSWWGFLGASLLPGGHQALAGQPNADQTKQEALQLLQQKVAQREKRAGTATDLPKLPDGRKMTYATVEEMYLTGQITARQLQKYIEALVVEPTAGQPQTDVLIHGEALEVLRKTEADPNKNPAPGPAIRSEQIALESDSTEPVEMPLEKDFADIEAKMDQLLKSRAEREASRSNIVEGAAKEAEQGQNKRQRLDSLLRLYIYGKITEKEYNQQRAQLISEPD